MHNAKKKPRLPRIERPRSYHVEDDTTHLWAVSYADFLMVLLSFFILFFSVTPDDKNNIIQKLADATSKGKSAETVSQGGVTQKEGFGEGDGEFDVESIQKTFRGLKIVTVKDRKKLILMFPDNAYLSGQYDLPSPLKDELKTVLEKLKPYEDSIRITFVGHADLKPVSQSRTSVLQNNFDLSSIRATRALKFSLGLGLKQSSVTASGDSSNMRDTRSLSIMIEPVGE